MSNDEWRTPDYIFKPLNDIFNFDCDLAATDENTKCDRWFTKERSCIDDAAEWGDMNWCNPPYSKGNASKFIGAAISRSLEGKRTVMLPKLDTTKAFAKTWGHGGHYFYYKRISFVGAKSGAKFPSVLVFFGALKSWEIRALEELGQGRLVFS